MPMPPKTPELSRAYDAFAELYDLYWGDYFLKDARQGIADVFLPHAPPGGRILDLCCGTGQLAAWLGQCGFQAIGLDSSPAMLARARRNAPAAELVEADARDFRLAAPVDAAISTFDSINHFATLADVERVFRCVALALAPRGRFLFDVNRREGFELAGDETFAVVENDHVLVAKSRFDRKKGVGSSAITTLTAEGDAWTRRDAAVFEFCYEPDEIAGALDRAGFAGWRVYDGELDFEMPRGEGRSFYLAWKEPRRSPA